MIPVQPTFMPQPFANSGEKNVIPNSGGEVLGNASFASGFPRVTETPIELGGVPPQRKDFNGILNVLSTFAFFAQSGGVYEYSATANYDTPAVVIYNNIFYFCLQQNGVDSVNGVKAPTNTTYWIPLIDYLLDGLAVGTPIGTIIMWASATNPQDGGVWLDCNGQSCTAYPKLVAIVGNTVPNLKGLFPRCVGSQSLNVTIHGTTTSQTFNGGTVGSKSADAIRNITGVFASEAQPGGLAGAAVWEGAFYGTENSDRSHIGGNYDGTNKNYNFDASRVVPTSTENKPVSVALRFLIKAQ
jgi:hypothetical protein